MALGPEAMAGQDRENNDITLDTEDACPLLSPEDNRRAATLLLNLAQALLNLPSPSRQATAAAAEAIRASNNQYPLLELSRIDIACLENRICCGEMSRRLVTQTVGHASKEQYVHD